MPHNQDERRKSCRALLLAAVALAFTVSGTGRGKEPQSPGPPVPAWARVSKEQIQAAAKAGVPVAKEIDLGGGVTMKMVYIPPGSFMMGSEEYGDEKPVHRVTITRGFYMGIHEVTQAQWRAVMGNNPAKFKGDHRPVETVSWNDCQEFIGKLNARGSEHFRLPTEAEWEYACRGGTTTKYYWGQSSPDAYAWYRSNSSGQTHPVSQKQPNAFGLYDMSGNVYEWCQDWYKKDYYGESPSTDPGGPTSAVSRVLRGGSCGGVDLDFRSANRNHLHPAGRAFGVVGVRVVWSRPGVR